MILTKKYINDCFLKDKNKAKLWMATELLKFQQQTKWRVDAEHKFNETRKWKCDYFIHGLLVAIEYEGLMSAKSRHTTLKGFSGDTEKYNAAALMGIKVLRYTQLTYTNLVNDLKEIRY